MVEAEQQIDGHPVTIERRYFLTSLDGGVERFAEASRSHWGIKNKLHWSLDVVSHHSHAPENVTKMALNLLAKESSKGSKKAKRLKAGWDNDFLVQVLLA